MSVLIKVITSLSLIFLFESCDPLCVAPAFVPEYCAAGDFFKDSILIADFESSASTALSGSIGFWKYTEDSVQGSAAIVKIPYDIIHGNYALEIEISNNVPVDTNQWSGAGMILHLSNCPEGMDLSQFSELKFDIKTTPGSQLEHTRIKLEDTSGVEQPAILINKHQEITTEWQTIGMPLADFTNASPDKTPLQPENVVRLLTVSENRRTIPANMKGTLLIDNIRFIK